MQHSIVSFIRYMRPMAAHLCSEGNWSGLPTKLLFRAMKAKDVALLRSLFNDPRHVGEADCIDGDGCSLLHLLGVTPVHNMDVARDLVAIVVVENGDNVDMHHCRRGDTPLMVAVLQGNYNVIRALIDVGGADPHGHVDWKGQSALDKAEEEAEASCRAGSSEAENRKRILKYIEEAAKKRRDFST